MNTRPLIALAASLSALSVALAALSAPPPPTAQPPMDAARLAQLKSLYSEKCSACHNLPSPEEKGFSRAEWQRTVDRMLNQHHASDSIAPAEAAQIVDYLATFAPKPGTRNDRSGDAWGTDAMDVPATAPAYSRVFNFDAPDALSGFSMIAAGTPGPPPAWRLANESTAANATGAKVSLAKPSPSRFALLVDRKDQARNVDIRVSFHILSGKVTPAVGIVFGFTGPNSYDVLVYNQARNDLSLIKIAEPTHTTLQQNPINLPAGTPGLLAAAVPSAAAPISGAHTLRLLVKDGQIRGWLDYTKRISVADPAYQGGKVGLWTQGDTVATFQNWLVDVYDGAPPSGLGV